MNSYQKYISSKLCLVFLFVMSIILPKELDSIKWIWIIKHIQPKFRIVKKRQTCSDSNVLEFNKSWCTYVNPIRVRAISRCYNINTGSCNTRTMSKRQVHLLTVEERYVFYFQVPTSVETKSLQQHDWLETISKTTKQIPIMFLYKM